MLYPLKFSPILKDKIWGGSKLKTLFNKKASSNLLGESWELSGYEGDESVVSNGFLAGNNLQELIEIYMGELVGDTIYEKHGLSFPLLFKLIDANENLSIQVHPGDEVAAERHNSYGKTEMWYVVDADNDAELIIGFSNDCTKSTYLNALKNNQVEELLQRVAIQKGDVFFIPAGLVHAIGKGAVIAEIQQSSDITYRIYDYNRKDEKGNERELHTDQALDVINFSAAQHPKTNYKAEPNASTNLVTCNYFTTNILRFTKSIPCNYNTIDSFVVYMCLDGGFSIEVGGEITSVFKGETVLIPASLDELTLVPTTSETTILEVYISTQHD
jgi:mannose-6-phosphate isomerase